MKFCPECGTKRNDTAKFCYECGYKFNHLDKEIQLIKNETSNLKQMEVPEYPWDDNNLNNNESASNTIFNISEEYSYINDYPLDISPFVTRNFSLTGFDSILSISFTADSKHIVASTSEGNIIFWDIEQQKQVFQITDYSYPQFIKFTPDGKLLIIGNHSNIYIWDMIKGQKIYEFSPDVYFQKYIISPNFKLMATVENETVRVWDIFKKEQISVIGNQNFVGYIQFTEDSNLLLFGDTNNEIVVWDYTNSQLVSKFSSTNKEGYCPILKVSSNSSIFSYIYKWIYEEPGMIFTKKRETRNIVTRPLGGDSDIYFGSINTDASGVVHIDYSPNQQLVAIGTTKEILFYHLDSKDKHKARVLDKKEGYVDVGNVSKVQFSPDGKYLASSDRKKIRIWQLY